ncbi:MAG: zinc-dependent peptidase [Chlorobi bacterium]|nr:zinc-dependent peptidase [Chlorobiota bacterium]
MIQIITILSILIFLLILLLFIKHFVKRKIREKEIINQPFPDTWREILNKRVRYYRNLPDDRKKEFEDRVKRFIAEKSISGVDTEVTDEDKLLVAASAIIPLFNFPYYNYPNVQEILLYPGSFDSKFQTGDKAGQKNILGMVGNGYMNGVVVLSKPDLKAAFDGTRHTNNVGIHEFIHLIDKADGAVDGVPEILFKHSYVLPWLKEVRKEMKKIKEGHSDINVYALTNDAEFLAVVSEYFFDNPEKLKKRHPELYKFLSNIFRQEPDKYV